MTEQIIEKVLKVMDAWDAPEGEKDWAELRERIKEIQPEKIIEFDVEKVIGLDEEERDVSVNYYVPFCLCFENEKGEQVQIFMDYDKLLEVEKLLRPYRENQEAEEARDEEMYKIYQEEKKQEKRYKKGRKQNG